MDNSDRDKPVPVEVATLRGGRRVVLRETQRAVTQYGGVAVFLSYLRKIGLLGTVRKHMPVCWRSPSRIDPPVSLAPSKRRRVHVARNADSLPQSDFLGAWQTGEHSPSV
jgi:hypothetical protein